MAVDTLCNIRHDESSKIAAFKSHAIRVVVPWVIGELEAI